MYLGWGLESGSRVRVVGSQAATGQQICDRCVTGMRAMLGSNSFSSFFPHGDHGGLTAGVVAGEAAWVSRG